MVSSRACSDVEDRAATSEQAREDTIDVVRHGEQVPAGLEDIYRRVEARARVRDPIEDAGKAHDVECRVGKHSRVKRRGDAGDAGKGRGARVFQKRSVADIEQRTGSGAELQHAL